jgi:hypothetical protein
MAADNRLLEIRWIGEYDIENLELAPEHLIKHNYIVNNNLNSADAITYLDDIPFKFWTRPRDIRA